MKEKAKEKEDTREYWLERLEMFKDDIKDSGVYFDLKSMINILFNRREKALKERTKEIFEKLDKIRKKYEPRSFIHVLDLRKIEKEYILK